MKNYRTSVSINNSPRSIPLVLLPENITTSTQTPVVVRCIYLPVSPPHKLQCKIQNNGPTKYYPRRDLPSMAVKTSSKVSPSRFTSLLMWLAHLPSSPHYLSTAFAMTIDYCSTENSTIELEYNESVSFLFLFLHTILLYHFLLLSLPPLYGVLCPRQQKTTTAHTPHGKNQTDDNPFYLVYTFLYPFDHSARQIPKNASFPMF